MLLDSLCKKSKTTIGEFIYYTITEGVSKLQMHDYGKGRGVDFVMK